MDANLNRSFEALGRKHDLLVGATYQKWTYDNDSQAYAGFAYDPFTYDPRNFQAKPTTFARAAGATTLETERSYEALLSFAVH